MDHEHPFRPGERVPQSGLYQVVRHGELLPGYFVRFEKGDVFPRRLGWLYWFAQAERPRLRASDTTE